VATPTTVDQNQGPLERLAICALEYVRDGMRIGLGSGRAAVNILLRIVGKVFLGV